MDIDHTYESLLSSRSDISNSFRLCAYMKGNKNAQHRMHKTEDRPLLSNSNEQQRRASASILCEDPFSSATPYAEELEHNTSTSIDFLINH